VIARTAQTVIEIEIAIVIGMIVETRAAMTVIGVEIAIATVTETIEATDNGVIANTETGSMVTAATATMVTMATMAGTVAMAPVQKSTVVTRTA